MILALGARGRGFESPLAPFFLFSDKKIIFIFFFGREISGKKIKSKVRKKRNIPGGIRTHNPLIRSQMPYPLGHKAGYNLLSGNGR